MGKLQKYKNMPTYFCLGYHLLHLFFKLILCLHHISEYRLHVGSHASISDYPVHNSLDVLPHYIHAPPLTSPLSLPACQLHL